MFSAASIGTGISFDLRYNAASRHDLTAVPWSCESGLSVKRPCAQVVSARPCKKRAIIPGEDETRLRVLSGRRRFFFLFSFFSFLSFLSFFFFFSPPRLQSFLDGMLESVIFARDRLSRAGHVRQEARVPQSGQFS